MSLPEPNDHELFDYNEVIENCSKLSDVGIVHFTSFLNSTSLKIKPSKHQSIKIKEVFTKLYSKVLDLKFIEFNVISDYTDYVVSICNNENEIEQVYLSMFKPYSQTSQSTPPPYRIVSILNTNKHHFNNDLKSKIIKELFIKIEQTVGVQKEVRFIYIIEILKLLNIGKTGKTSGENQQQSGNDEIFKKQEIQITELIKSSLFKEITNYSAAHIGLLEIFDYRNYDFMSLDIIDWIIQLLGNEIYTTLYTDLLLLVSLNSGKHYFNYMDKYQNQIINSINNDTSVFYIGGMKDGKKRKEFEPIVSILIKSKQFNVAQFRKLINNIIHCERLEKTFRDWLPYDILVDVLVELYSGLKLIEQSDLNKFINSHFHNSRIISNHPLSPRHIMVSVFQINEKQFVDKLGQDEFTLFEIYKTNFRNIFSSQLIDTDYVVPFLFSNLSTSPIKKSFLSDKIEYLIEICNLNIINNWILPNFNDECMRSKTYQLKSASVNLQSIGKQLSSVLIDEMFNQYLNNNSTSMYQKLQLSLVSKKSFQRVKSLMNNSMDIPVPVSCISFLKDNCDSEYSLFDCGSIRYLNYSTIMVSHTNQEQVLKLYTLLNKCKSIEILQLSFSDLVGYQFNKFEMLFNWLNWYNSSGGGKLKKLILQVNLELNTVQTIQDFQLLNSDIEISIQLLPRGNIGKNRKALYEFDKFNITKLEIPISNYFRHGLLKSAGISIIRNLKLAIDFQNHRVDEESLIKYFKKYGKNWINQQDGSTSLSNLKTLELSISADYLETSGRFRFYKELFNYISSKVSSNLKEIIIYFSSVMVNHSIIEMILRLIFNNPQFNSVSQISIPTFYSNSILHSFNKLSLSATTTKTTIYSFIQQSLNYNRIDSIEFVRNVKHEEKQVCQIKNNKRKFNEIDKQQEQEEVQKEEEKEEIDFNTDSDVDSDESDDSNI